MCDNIVEPGNPTQKALDQFCCQNDGNIKDAYKKIKTNLVDIETLGYRLLKRN